jgi:translation initiation factor 5B
VCLQTLESISLLRRKRTPFVASRSPSARRPSGSKLRPSRPVRFVVALNKVDRCYNWKSVPDGAIRDALAAQDESTLGQFKDKFGQAKVQLNEQGLNVALYWENDDPGTTVSVIPTSAISGEGVPDLIATIVRLTQRRLADSLMYNATLQCTVLEVKMLEGIGTTIDVILVNGTLHEGDTLVLCSADGAIVTQARALLTPPPAREMRVKTEFVHHKSIQAAMGIKICAQDLGGVTPGTSLMVCGPDDDVEDIKEEVMKDMQGLTDTLATESKGVFVQASTLGALEALLEFLRAPGKDRQGVERPAIPVSGVSIGPIQKKDVIKASIMLQKKSPEYATILGFDVPVAAGVREFAESSGVRIFTADIIYHLEDQFTRYLDEVMEERRKAAADIAVFPTVISILPQHIINKKDPIIVGCHVEEGVLRVGTPLCIPENGHLDVGIVTGIQVNQRDQDKAKKGTDAAVKIANASNPTLTYGRQFDHEKKLYSKLSRESIDALKAYFKDEMDKELGNDGWRLVVKMKKVYGIL